MRVLGFVVLACALFLAAAADPGRADAAPKVLVFTGGATNGSVTAASAALSSMAGAEGFEVTTSSSSGDFTAANLSQYRAVVLLHNTGTPFTSAQQIALSSYVNDGGGLLTIGEAIGIHAGSSTFNTLFGIATGARFANVAGTPEYTVEAVDRAHPATRNLPVLHTRSGQWYSYTQNPTGTSHVVARIRTADQWRTDNPRRAGASTRPVAWCRDQQNGRTFYTGLGGSAADWSNTNFRSHILGAIQWTAAMSRGGCKATIDTNYQYTRLIDRASAAADLTNAGESHGLSIAENGWVIYIGRTNCANNNERGARVAPPVASQGRIYDRNNPNVGVGCGTVHVWDPEAATGGLNTGITRAGTLAVYGDLVGGDEQISGGTGHKINAGLVGVTVAPDFAETGHIYLMYLATFNPATVPPGPADSAARRVSKMAQTRVSRFTLNLATKQLNLASEVRVLEFDTQIWSCCHQGGGMAFDSTGNLYITTGDTTSSYGNYSANWQGFRCATGPVDQATNTHCGANAVSFRDARRTSGNTADFNGKLLRIKPIASVPDGTQPTVGIGTTYDIPGSDAPNGPNLFSGFETQNGQPAGASVRGQYARPEIYAMGLRNPSRLNIDPETDIPHAAWVGPDATGTNTTATGTAEGGGPSKYESAVRMDSAGNYGWPYCVGGSLDSRPQAYRDRLVNNSLRTTNTSGYVNGPADSGGNSAGWYDCDNIANDSQNNTGIVGLLPHVTGTGKDAGKSRPANLWYAGSSFGGGCPDYTRTASGVPNYGSGATQLCPYSPSGGSQAIMSGPVYRYDEGENNTRRWPRYWDGRWLIADFEGGTANPRQMLLLEEGQAGVGKLPQSVDDVRPFVTWDGGQYMDSKFGPDGALYVQPYDGSYSAGPRAGLVRIAFTGGPETPNPVAPTWDLVAPQTLQFTPGRSGGVAWAWDFENDGTIDSTAEKPTHQFTTPGERTMMFRVTYADGEVREMLIPLTGPTVGTPPVSSHQLDPATPDGSAGWYRSDVRVALDSEHPVGVDRLDYRINGGAWNEYNLPVPAPAEVPILAQQSHLAQWLHVGAGAPGLAWNTADGGFFRTAGGIGMAWYPVEYGDFKLKLQWRDSSGPGVGNAGVFVRFPDLRINNADKPQTYTYEWPGPVPAAQTYTGTYCGRYGGANGDSGDNRRTLAGFCGYEIQINDHQTSEPDKSGSIYDIVNIDATQAMVQPKGTWVDYEITVVGQQYEVKRNGVVINSLDASVPLASSADKPPTQARQFSRGYIGLQNHGADDAIDFRNVRVQNLDGVAGTNLTLKNDGIHTVEYRGTDGEGTVEVTKSTGQIKIDRTPPVSSMVTNPPHPGAVGTFSGPVQVTFAGDDGASGVASVEYRLGTTGSFLPYTGPFTVAEDGDHVVQFRATDVAGNVEQLRTEEFTIGDPTGCLAMLSDGFNGNSLDQQKWPVMLREMRGHYGVADGRLSIDFLRGDFIGLASPPATAGPYGTARNVPLMDAPSGAWTATTKLDVSEMNVNSTQAGLIIWKSDTGNLGGTNHPTNLNNFVKIPFIQAGDGTRRFERAVTINGTLAPTVANSSTTPVEGVAPDAEVLIRATYTGSQLSAEYSLDDGSTWGTIGTVSPVAFAGPFKIGVYATRGANANEGAAHFDWFRVEKSDCPARVSVDSSAASGIAPATVDFTADVADKEDTLGQLNLSWNFGDGTSASGQLTRQHVFHSPGTYKVTLTATDTAGNVSRRSTTVVVHSELPTCATKFDDEFNGNGIDPKWDVLRRHADDVNVGNPNDGGLHLRIGNGDLSGDQSTGRNILLQQAPAGPFTATTTIDVRGATYGPSDQVGLVLWRGEAPNSGSNTASVNTLAKIVFNRRVSGTTGDYWTERSAAVDGTGVSGNGNTGQQAYNLTNGRLHLRVSSNGANPPVITAEKSIDGTNWQPVQAAFTFGGTGDLKIGIGTYKATNAIDTIREAVFESFRVTHEDVCPEPDTEPPVTSHQLSPATANGLAGWWTTPPQVTLTATDNETPQASIITGYRFGAAPGFTNYSSPFVVNQQGETTVSYRSVDGSGNQETQKHFTVNVDSVAPTSSHVMDPALPDGAGDTWLPGASLVLSGADATSGLARIEYSTNSGSTWTTYSSSAPPSFDVAGVHTVQYRAVDHAGLAESPVHSTTFVVAPGIDPQPPSLSATLKPKKLKVKAGKSGKVTIRIVNGGGVKGELVKVCATGPKKKVKVPKCKQLGDIEPSAAKQAKLSFKLAKKAKGKVKVKVKITSANAPARTVTLTITIRK